YSAHHSAARRQGSCRQRNAADTQLNGRLRTQSVAFICSPNVHRKTCWQYDDGLACCANDRDAVAALSIQSTVAVHASERMEDSASKGSRFDAPVARSLAATEAL